MPGTRGTRTKGRRDMSHETDRSDSSTARKDRETLLEIARQIARADTPDGTKKHESGAREDAGEHATPGTNGRSADTRGEELVASRIFEALPAGLALCSGREIIRANSSFALAFGYQSLDELLAAGGLAAIFPNHVERFDDLMQSNGIPRQELAKFEAVTRSRRRIAIPLAIHDILELEDQPIRLLVLHPQPAPGARQATEPEDTSGNRADDQECALPTAHREAAKGEQAAREAEFLAKISHGVRTPLNSIIGFAELIKEERLGPVANERYKRYISDIHESGQFALSIINDLLDISRIDAGQFELNFTSVDVNEVIADCIHSMQAESQESRVFLRISLSDKLPAVLADRESVRQILLNLLTNAIKFTNPGGQVVVATSGDPSGQVRIRVRDNGTGLSKDEIAQTMHPFRRPDTAPRKLLGTGLALPLSRALAQANRAEFELKTTPASGTSIDVTFPPARTLKR